MVLTTHYIKWLPATQPILPSRIIRGKELSAKDAGLERGNWIMLVDGDSITKKTEERLIDGGARTLRIGKYVIVKEENNGGTEGDTENGENEEEDKEVGIIQESRRCCTPGSPSGNGERHL